MELIFEISEDQMKYLSRAEFLSADFRRSVLWNKHGMHGRIEASVPIEKAQIARDALTLRLAEVGFDENYELNSEGVMIEDLIDILFVE